MGTLESSEAHEELRHQHAALLARNVRLEKALQEIADGIMPNDEIDAILEISMTDMIRAKDRMYAWCQSRARKALSKNGARKKVARQTTEGHDHAESQGAIDPRRD